MQNSIANYGDFEAKYLQWPSLSQRDSYITVQFHVWPVQIIKKNFGTFLVCRSSSNPAHLAQN